MGDHRLTHIVIDQVAQILHGIISRVDIAADVARLSKHHVHIRLRKDRVVNSGCGQIAVLCRKLIGIGGINMRCHVIRLLTLSHQGIECVERLLRCLQFTGQDTLHHILGDTEHLAGSQTDIHLVLLDIGLDVVQLGQQLQCHILIIGDHVLAVGDAALAFLAQHGCHDPQKKFLPLGVLHCFLAGGHMEGGIGQVPVISLRIAEIRQQNGAVSLTAGERDHIGPSAAVHGQLAGSVQSLGVLVGHLRFGFPEAGLFLHVKELLKDRHPYFFGELIGSTALVLLPPLPAFHGQKLRDGKALQHFHTGIIRTEIRAEALDAQLLKGLAGRDKRVIIRGNGNVMLFEQRLIDNNAVHIRASRQPVDGAVIIGVVVQIGAIEGRRQLRITQVVQKILDQHRVLQGKPAHR